MKIITITRFNTNELSTIGKLEVDGKSCFILEDTFRPGEEKIYGETCIPNGTYKLNLVKSGRLHRWLSVKFPKIYKGVIVLENVKGFTGICFHPGITRESTLGCLLPCADYKENSVGNKKEFITTWESSYKAYQDIYPIIADYIEKGDTYFKVEVAIK